MVEKSRKTTASVIIGTLLLLAVVIATSPPIFDKLIPYIILLSISYMTYLISPFMRYASTISFKGESAIRAASWGVVFGVGFYALTRFVPGLSIGIPTLPAAISDSLESVIIVGVAPIVEEIFFRGVLLAFLLSTPLGRKNQWFAIVGQAALFALAHVGAYITGIYEYPAFAVGLDAFMMNIGAFMAAFAFGLLAGVFVNRNRIKNLTFAIVFHSIVNAILWFQLSVVVISVVLPLL
jgi:membrane protease YdiL (CAAX protease family)